MFLDTTVWTPPGEQPEPMHAMVALAFPSPTRAKEALFSAMVLQEYQQLRVHDAVFLYRPNDAPAQVLETNDPTPADAAMPVSLLGALLGVLLAGSLGLVLGGALGAGTGALAAKLLDTGIPDDIVVQLREMTAPGDTVLALLVSDIQGPAVIEELRRHEGARVIYATLPAAALELVRRTLAPGNRAQA